MSKPKDENMHNAIQDLLMDGPGSLRDIALELNISEETARRHIRKLEFEKLVVVHSVLDNGSARPVTLYDVARTRKAA